MNPFPRVCDPWFLCCFITSPYTMVELRIPFSSSCSCATQNEYSVGRSPIGGRATDLAAWLGRGPRIVDPRERSGTFAGAGEPREPHFEILPAGRPVRSPYSGSIVELARHLFMHLSLGLAIPQNHHFEISKGSFRHSRGSGPARNESANEPEKNNDKIGVQQTINSKANKQVWNSIRIGHWKNPAEWEGQDIENDDCNFGEWSCTHPFLVSCYLDECECCSNQQDYPDNNHRKTPTSAGSPVPAGLRSVVPMLFHHFAMFHGGAADPIQQFV